MVIAIDGFSSCGKSTLAKDLANHLNYTYVDSGAMYRAVTYFFIQNMVDITDSQEVEENLRKIEITYEASQMALNGCVLEDELRTTEVAALVSPVAAISSVRRKLVEWQRLCGQGGNIIMDGRDIGTVVFPNADHKFFITASLPVRALRRFLELREKGIHTSLEEVSQNLQERDHIDSSRADSPLRQAEDARVIDTTHLNREQQLLAALAYIEDKQ